MTTITEPPQARQFAEQGYALFPGALAGDALALLTDQRRVTEVRISGQPHLVAIEDVGRLRDALGVPVPPGTPEVFADPVDDPLGDLVARYARTADPATCEVAVVVLDDWQDQGLGTLLLRRLIDAARRHGLKRMLSLDFAANREMDLLARALGFRPLPDPGDRTQVLHVLDL